MTAAPPGGAAHGVCAYCGAGVRLPASSCWMCGRPLVVRQETGPARDDADGTWLVVVLLVAAMLLVVAVALAFEAPGFLIPYAVLAMPVVIGLVLIAFRKRLPTLGAPPSQQIQSTSQADAGQAVRAPQTTTTSSTGSVIAKAMLIVLVIVLASILLMLVAVVIFAIICFGILFSSSGGHF